MKGLFVKVRKDYVTGQVLGIIAALVILTNCLIETIEDGAEAVCGGCAVKKLKMLIERLNNDDRVKEAKEVLAKTKKKVSEGTKKAVEKTVEKVQELKEKNEVNLEENIEKITAPIAICLISMQITLLISFAEVLLFKHNSMIILAMFGGAIPATILMLVLRFFGIISDTRLFLSLYKSLPYFGLERKAKTIFLVQRKLYTAIGTTIMMTTISYIILRVALNGSTGWLYGIVTHIFMKVFVFAFCVMFADGILIFILCVISMLLSCISDKKHKRAAKGQRKIALLIKEFTYKPKRLMKQVPQKKERFSYLKLRARS